MTTLRVLAPGAMTTVQDGGRRGWRHLGVCVAGALDPAQAALANRLVGNTPDAAVLELTMTGPTLAFARPLRVALCGAHADMHFTYADDTHAGGTPVALPHGRPLALPAGTLRIGTLRTGLRAWLAISGGIDVPRIMGSRSTDLRGGFGGLDGRALVRDDVLPLGSHDAIEFERPTHPAWWIDLDAGLAHGAPIRVLPADADACARLAAHAWRVDPRSNRQGLRLQGDAFAMDAPEPLSAPVAPGTIQLPPDGQPIVLLADAQTVGGYPRLGHVIAADLPRLAQLRPGDALRFERVDAAAAHAALQRRRAEIARLEWTIDRMLANTP